MRGKSKKEKRVTGVDLERGWLDKLVSLENLKGVLMGLCYLFWLKRSERKYRALKVPEIIRKVADNQIDAVYWVV
jgi:hypothetical protein